MNTPACRPTARIAAAIIAGSALALLATACSSGGPTSAGSGTASAGTSASSRPAVAFSGCMRSHGVLNYPDPDRNGNLPKVSPQRLGVSGPRFSAAERACQHLLPATGGSLTATSLQQCYLAEDCPQALVQHALTAGRGFARCMRAHGVADWPDPSVDAEGRPVFNINVPRPTPPPVNTAINECERLDHAGSLLAWG